MACEKNSNDGLKIFLAVLGALFAIASIAALIVKFIVLKDVKYNTCYQCGCDEDDDFEDEDDESDFVDEEENEEDKPLKF